MKCDELTPIDLECNMGKDINGVEHREPWKAYDIDEVNAAIAELKHKLEEQEQEIAGLNVMMQDACLERDENPVVDELTEQLLHQKYKRCLAKKAECKLRSVRYQDLWEKWRKTEYDTSGSYYRDYIKWWHRAMKWKKLAEKFKTKSTAL